MNLIPYKFNWLVSAFVSLALLCPPMVRAAGTGSSTPVVTRPVICTPGYMDATCAVPITSGPVTAPTCSTAAGWTTVTPAQWAGFKYTSPVCNYTAPPSCPSGYIQSGPSWNGSSWVGLSCIPPTPPPPPTAPSLIGSSANAWCTDPNGGGWVVYTLSWSNGTTTSWGMATNLGNCAA